MQRNTNGSQISAPALGLRVAVALGVLTAFVALGAVAGCSGDGSDNRSSSAPAASTTTGGGSVAATAAVLTPPAEPSKGSRVVALGDSLPPEVEAIVEDSLAAPGEVVAITAQGSDDVSQIGLSDGRGRMQLFTRDSGSNVWHVLYRVPLKSTKDKLALSVTALNDVNRWRRVWVFVNVQKPGTVDGDEDGSGDDVHEE
jgi:hypothetical protein